VVINEFGEVALDHLLLQRVDPDTVVLATGCVCCTLRDDLGAALRELLDKRERGRVPPFERLVLETTGLADPAPILFTLTADPVLQHHFRLGSVVTTLDAVNGARHLVRHLESIKQVAVADRMVLTKTDLVDRASIEGLRAAVSRYNPTAPIFETPDPSLALERLFTAETFESSRRVGEGPDAGKATVRGEGAGEAGDVLGPHVRDITAVSLIVEGALDWTAFGMWLTMLLHAHGDDILRVKGILRIRGVATPVVIHGIHHLVHPPTSLPRWPTADHRSRLVLIVRSVPAPIIERSLRAFLRLAPLEQEAA
jgi:G3E family GTPase